MVLCPRRIEKHRTLNPGGLSEETLMIERVHSGIEGLDELIHGGFPKGDFILLAGASGSGKTIFCTHFICNGVLKYGEKGVYATFEEDRQTLIRNMKELGFDLEALEEKGMVKILDLKALKGSGLSSNIELIFENVANMGAERLVIDSLTAFLSACEEKFEYRTMMHLFYLMLKHRGCTTIATVSIPLGAKTLGLGVEEFVADGLIMLENFLDGLELKRRILIRKIRGSDHSKSYHNVLITRKGMEIVPFASTYSK